MKTVLIVIFILLSASLVGGVYWCYHLYTLKYNGIITSGKIIGYEKVPCGESWWCFYHTIKLNTNDSSVETIRLNLQKKYGDIGDSIVIMYQPEHLEEAQVVDDKVHLKNCIGGVLFILFSLAGVIWCLSNMDKVNDFMTKYVGEPF